jgi:hypothetical protein
MSTPGSSRLSYTRHSKYTNPRLLLATQPAITDHVTTTFQPNILWMRANTFNRYSKFFDRQKLQLETSPNNLLHLKSIGRNMTLLTSRIKSSTAPSTRASTSCSGAGGSKMSRPSYNDSRMDRMMVFSDVDPPSGPPCLDSIISFRGYKNSIT